MQLVLCKNRVVAHGENFLSMGGVVINTETGAKYENATVAECSCCPSDIDTVGYEYHAGVFVPCAPYGKGNNNGYFMEVCESCATPRNSGIPIKNGIKLENLNEEVLKKFLRIELLWENEIPEADFVAQTITLETDDCIGFVVITSNGGTAFLDNCSSVTLSSNSYFNFSFFRSLNKELNYIYERRVYVNETRTGLVFNRATIVSPGNMSGGSDAESKPLKIYGVKL